MGCDTSFGHLKVLVQNGFPLGFHGNMKTILSNVSLPDEGGVS